MRPVCIVEIEVARKLDGHLPGSLVGVEVDALVLHTPPQPLDEHIIDPAPLAVHADAHARGFQNRGEVPVGELAALVGVEDLRGAVAAQRLISLKTVEAVGLTITPALNAAGTR
jgi:hypothetical protein